MSQERIQELEIEVRRHSELYYNGMPEITDAEFDELVDELRELDPTSAALAEVGAIPTWGRKVKHPSLMGSLAKVNESTELLDWYNGLPGSAPKKLLASTKVDGLAVRLRYVKGRLVEAATRGDGEIGQDVLENVKHVKTVPQEVDSAFSGEVRGEVYMSKEVWESFGGTFANPRNGAAGGLLQKDANETEHRKLDFLGYDIKCDDAEAEDELLAQYRAERLGFAYVQWEEVDPVHLESYLLDWEENRRATLDFQIDGLVFTIDSVDLQEEAGWNGKRPRGKIAWKFKPEQREATVMGCTWQVGRTGKLTPVLHIEPTHIDGSTISNISLASAGRFDELKLGRGEKVLVEKAGDIIPQVVRVTWRPLNGSKLVMPDDCPSCNAPAKRDGAHLFCTNPACASQLSRRVLYWLNMHDVKGVGPSIVAEMCGRGIVKDLSDLYYLDADKLYPATGSRKIAQNIIQEVMMKSEMPLWKFMAGLGIPSLGKTASKAIAKRYADIDEVMDATVDDLLILDGIGGVTATQILSGLAHMQEEIEALKRVVEIEEPVTGGCLSGLSFCLTGAMSRKRNEIAADIEAVGGEVKSSVGKGLNYLVQADPSSQSSKTKKAEKYGTKVISEEELMEMLVQ
jgi:DNA ligase (NAD+)